MSTAPTTTSTHPVAVRNRVAKAQRIVAFIDAHPATFHNATADDAACWPNETWDLLNMAMGEARTATSQLTRSTVIGILAGRA